MANKQEVVGGEGVHKCKRKRPYPGTRDDF